MADADLVEKCGIVGVFSKKYSRSLALALSAAGGVQHRGQQGAGLVLKTKSGIKTYKARGILKEIFTQEKIDKFNFPFLWALIHCRYGTYGGFDQSNYQPCIVKSSNNELITVVHNGEFAKVSDFIKIINLSKGTKVNNETSDTYLFAHALSKIKGNNWDTKIVDFLSMARGAFSLMIGINDSMYIARDNLGIRPLIIGEINNGWLVASETHAFNKVGAKIIREVRKGEIIKIEQKGLTVLKKESKQSKHFCDFEWAYFSRPDSFYPTSQTSDSSTLPKNWLSVSLFRERTGEILAKESPIKNATFVIGVPDSGIHLGNGYANTLKLPYRQAIVRDHYDRNGSDRLFMRDDQMRLISKKVLGKLSIVADFRIWKDAIVVLADDSIVRGNVSKRITKAIFALGAKEVHWVIGFPPVRHKCHLGVSIRSGEELIAASTEGNGEKIAKKLGATSVSYISYAGFIKARLWDSKVKIPKNINEIFLANNGCGGCLTGLYPVSQNGDYYNE